MGSSWTNLLLRTEAGEGVGGALRRHRLLPAFVYRGTPGWLSVYPEATETDDDRFLETCLRGLTYELGCAGIATLMLEGETLLYFLADKGRLIDSFQHMLAGRPLVRGGDPRLLVQTLRLGTAEGDVQAALSGALRRSPPGRPGQSAPTVEELMQRGLSSQQAHAVASVQAALFGQEPARERGDVDGAALAPRIASALERTLGLSPGQLQIGYAAALEGDGPDGLEYLT